MKKTDNDFRTNFKKNRGNNNDKVLSFEQLDCIPFSCDRS